ncbi:hypothetical protein PILCRDRAFT_17231 [Piloderma croceum F 1598]|uniref:Uncharacterized protein n=1 Tax=Piloderma croceum (strain F 1598) TaxID=765440 RepID=A0A0C3EF22_PILCF|nr:hypothetical protein PILCRDRAFT_17231 [Piloderma croceum F 1598]
MEKGGEEMERQEGMQVPRVFCDTAESPSTSCSLDADRNRALPNARPHHCHHLVVTTPPPPPIIHHRSFQQRPQNRATTARFRVFGPKPTTPACAAQRVTPPPLSPRRHHPTTSPHRSTLLFPTARPKPSPSGPVSSFWPQTCNPGLRSTTCDPTTAVTSSTPPHHLSASSPAAVSHGAPETELQQLGFAFLAQTPSPSLAFPTERPHHHRHNNNTIPSSLHIIPCCCFTRRARNRAVTARFRVFDPNPLKNI